MSSNPYLNRIAKRDSGHHGRVAEKQTAKRLGGRTQPGSGAVEGAKGDVVLTASTMQFLLENKATANDSMSIKLDWLLKVYQEALETGRVPALSVQFTALSGKSEKRGRWVMIPEATFQELIEG